jgi:hypothetical protein
LPVHTRGNGRAGGEVFRPEWWSKAIGLSLFDEMEALFWLSSYANPRTDGAPPWCPLQASPSSARWMPRRCGTAPGCPTL